jgi:succinyl-diaminopimelate desuccinylase
MSSEPDPARIKGDLATLVAADSQNPPGREHEVAERVRALGAAMGLSCDLSEYAPGRSTIVLRLENGPGPAFAFNTHLDTVPAGTGWTTDPLVLREDVATGRLYGRGACDAKGPLAAMLEAMRLLAASPSAWSGTLLGIFVADEEVASAGAKALVRAGRPRPDAVIVGEPTGNATYTAHKGSLRPVVRVRGLAAHSGTPELGRNAIFEAAKLMPLLAAQHEAIACRCRHPLVGRGSLTVTRIQGGHADNVVPDACDLLLDRRLIPGEDEAAALAEIEALLARAVADFGVDGAVVGFHETTGGPTETDEAAPIVQASLAACRAHRVPDPGPLGFQGGCDLVHFRSLGADGVVIGPGNLSVAHKPDEYVPTGELVVAALIYRDVALRMLAP